MNVRLAYISPFTVHRAVGLKRLKRGTHYLLAKQGSPFLRGYHFNTKFSGGWIEHWDHRCRRQRNQPPSIPAPRIFSSKTATPTTGRALLSTLLPGPIIWPVRCLSLLLPPFPPYSQLISTHIPLSLELPLRETIRPEALRLANCSAIQPVEFPEVHRASIFLPLAIFSAFSHATTALNFTAAPLSYSRELSFKQVCPFDCGCADFVLPTNRRGIEIVEIQPTMPRAGIKEAHPAGIWSDLSVDGPVIGTLIVVLDKAVSFFFSCPLSRCWSG